MGSAAVRKFLARPYYSQRAVLASPLSVLLQHSVIIAFASRNPPGQRAGSPRTFNLIVNFLRTNTPDFISPELWPPCSPDLNVVDYEIWGRMQERVYKKPPVYAT